jgi:hypothetical protein
MKLVKGLLVAALSLAACGPNYRYVYDGEAAFERCYALDYDENAGAPTRQQCWSAWLQSYAFGAGADRVEYARAHATPQAAPLSAPPPAPMAMRPAPPTNPQRPVLPIAPAPDAFSTPAVTQSAAATAWRREQISVGGNPIAAPPPTEAPATPENEPPGASCANDCHTTWHTCGTRCTGNDAACVARCDDTYRDCMRGCF